MRAGAVWAGRHDGLEGRALESGRPDRSVDLGRNRLFGSPLASECDRSPRHHGEPACRLPQGRDLERILHHPPSLNHALGRDQRRRWRQRGGQPVEAADRQRRRLDANPWRLGALQDLHNGFVVSAVDDLEIHTVRGARREQFACRGRIPEIHNEHAAVCAEDRRTRAPAEPGQVAHVRQVRDHEGLDPCGAHVVPRAREPMDERRRGRRNHRESPNNFQLPKSQLPDGLGVKAASTFTQLVRGTCLGVGSWRLGIDREPVFPTLTGPRRARCAPG